MLIKGAIQWFSYREKRIISGYYFDLEIFVTPVQRVNMQGLGNVRFMGKEL